MIEILPQTKWTLTTFLSNPQERDAMVSRLKMLLNTVLESTQPVTKRITIYNQTKTAQVRVHIAEDGEMRIYVHDSEEDYRFQFKGEANDQKENPVGQKEDSGQTKLG